jgi:hypothetical protein
MDGFSDMFDSGHAVPDHLADLGADLAALFTPGFEVSPSHSARRVLARRVLTQQVSTAEHVQAPGVLATPLDAALAWMAPDFGSDCPPSHVRYPLTAAEQAARPLFSPSPAPEVCAVAGQADAMLGQNSPQNSPQNSSLQNSSLQTSPPQTSPQTSTCLDGSADLAVAMAEIERLKAQLQVKPVTPNTKKRPFHPTLTPTHGKRPSNPTHGKPSEVELSPTARPIADEKGLIELMWSPTSGSFWPTLDASATKPARKKLKSAQVQLANPSTLGEKLPRPIPPLPQDVPILSIEVEDPFSRMLRDSLTADLYGAVEVDPEMPPAEMPMQAEMPTQTAEMPLQPASQPTSNSQHVFAMSSANAANRTMPEQVPRRTSVETPVEATTHPDTLHPTSALARITAHPPEHGLSTRTAPLLFAHERPLDVLMCEPFSSLDEIEATRILLPMFYGYDPRDFWATNHWDPATTPRRDLLAPAVAYKRRRDERARERRREAAKRAHQHVAAMHARRQRAMHAQAAAMRTRAAELQAAATQMHTDAARLLAQAEMLEQSPEKMGARRQREAMMKAQRRK